MDQHLPEQRIETPHLPDGSLSTTNSVWWSTANIHLPDRFLSHPDNTGFSEAALIEEWRNFLALHRLLLSIGGTETCLPITEEDMHSILNRGRFYPGRSKMMVGQPSQCHKNSCELWLRNRKQFQVNIATGYALSSDGLWRQHTWLIHRYQTRTQSRMRLVETTVKRLGYFGFEMTEDEALRFCDSNGIF